MAIYFHIVVNKPFGKDSRYFLKFIDDLFLNEIVIVRWGNVCVTCYIGAFEK